MAGSSPAGDIELCRFSERLARFRGRRETIMTPDERCVCRNFFLRSNRRSPRADHQPARVLGVGSALVAYEPVPSSSGGLRFRAAIERERNRELASLRKPVHRTINNKRRLVGYTPAAANEHSSNNSFTNSQLPDGTVARN